MLAFVIWFIMGNLVLVFLQFEAIKQDIDDLSSLLKDDDFSHLSKQSKRIANILIYLIAAFSWPALIYLFLFEH